MFKYLTHYSKDLKKMCTSKRFINVYQSFSSYKSMSHSPRWEPIGSSQCGLVVVYETTMVCQWTGGIWSTARVIQLLLESLIRKASLLKFMGFYNVVLLFVWCLLQTKTPYIRQNCAGQASVLLFSNDLSWPTAYTFILGPKHLPSLSASSIVSGKCNTIMSFWRKGVSGMVGVMEERLKVQVN